MLVILASNGEVLVIVKVKVLVPASKVHVTVAVAKDPVALPTIKTVSALAVVPNPSNSNAPNTRPNLLANVNRDMTRLLVRFQNLSIANLQAAAQLHTSCARPGCRMSVAGAIATLERVQPDALNRNQELNLDWHAGNWSKPEARRRSTAERVEIAVFKDVSGRMGGLWNGVSLEFRPHSRLWTC